MAERRERNSSQLSDISPMLFDMDHQNSNHSECDHVRIDTRVNFEEESHHACSLGDREPQEHNTTSARMHRLRSETSSALVVMCLMTGAGLIFMCFPFLHGKHSTSTFLSTFYTVRSGIMAFLALPILIVFIWMTSRLEHLHEEGIVIWPKRCRNCLEALSQVNSLILHKNSIPNQSLESRHEKILDLSVSNVTLNITYIFSGLVLLSIFSDTASIALCFNEHSHDPFAETNKELIGQLITYVIMVLIVYFFSFHFIPNFCDAQFIATTKIRWIFVFFIEMGMWTSIRLLVLPFNHLGEGGKYTNHHCALNSTSGEFLKGILDISHPFLVEFPVMMTWLFIEMWFRFLPPHTRGIIKSIHRTQKQYRGRCHCATRIARRSNWIRLWSFYNSFLIPRKNRTQRSDVHSLKSSQNYMTGQSISSYGSFEMISLESHNGSPCNVQTRSVVDMTLGKEQSKRALSRKMERAIALILLIYFIYFGMSHFVLAEESGLRGRYWQWVLRIAFFTPVVGIICKQMKLTGKRHEFYFTKHGSFAHGPSEENKKMLLLTLSGACLYEMFCIVASFGNLFSSSGLSHEETVLNVVSVFSGSFGVLRKCIQSIFLLHVQYQQPRNYQETQWTLLCLIAVGITSATQWLWDSLIHKVRSPLAWPALELYFDGKIGVVIAMLFVPFDHLYELHAAIMAHEVYKLTWNVKLL